MMWHIFIKDWKLLRVFVIALAVVEMASAAAFFFVLSDASALAISKTLNTIAAIGAVFVVVALAQQDILPGNQQDWLVRPIDRRDLLLAKLAFIVILIHAPKFAADFVEQLANRLPVSSSLAMAAERGLWFFVTLTIVWLACSSALASPGQAVGVGLLMVFFTQVFISPTVASSGLEWIPRMAAAAIILVACAIVLRLTFFGRRFATAQLVLVGAFFLPAIIRVIPFAQLYALQEAMSPEPGAARNIGLTPMPAAGERQERVLVTGLAPDEMLYVDRVGTSDGINPAPFWRERGQAYLQHNSKFGRGAVDYYVTLLRVARVETFPADGGGHGVPGIGLCVSRVNLENTAVQVDCLEDEKMPSCYTLNLEGSPAGTQNFEESNCIPDYAPTRERIGRSINAGHVAQVKFRQLGSTIRYPVNETNLPQARLVMRIYAARDHFVRRLTF